MKMIFAGVLFTTGMLIGKYACSSSGSDDFAKDKGTTKTALEMIDVNTQRAARALKAASDAGHDAFEKSDPDPIIIEVITTKLDFEKDDINIE